MGLCCGGEAVGVSCYKSMDKGVEKRGREYKGRLRGYTRKRRRGKKRGFVGKEEVKRTMRVKREVRAQYIQRNE
jgi:hypothetical protein